MPTHALYKVLFTGPSRGGEQISYSGNARTRAQVQRFVADARRVRAAMILVVWVQGKHDVPLAALTHLGGGRYRIRDWD